MLQRMFQRILPAVSALLLQLQDLAADLLLYSGVVLFADLQLSQPCLQEGDLRVCVHLLYLLQTKKHPVIANNNRAHPTSSSNWVNSIYHIHCGESVLR